MHVKPGDLVFVYGPCTAADWHHGDKAYKVLSVNEHDGAVKVQVSKSKYWPDECEVHERQCEVKLRKEKVSNGKQGKDTPGKRIVSKSKRRRTRK